MLTIVKELKKVMTEFFDNIEANISKIHLANGVDNQTVTKEIADAVTSNVTPLQTQLTDQQTQIGELQKAMQDIVTALTNGDTAAAQATATAAAGAGAASTGGTDSGAAGSTAS